MKGYIVMLVALLCFSVEIVFAQTDNNDTQVWNLNSIEFPLDKDNEKISGVILTDLRLTDDISDLTDKRVGFGVVYKATKNLTIQGSYMFRVDTALANTNRYEHHFLFDVTPGKDFKKFSLDNRSRLEHRIKTAGRNDDTYYRNRTRIRIPVKNKDKTVFTPFVWNDTWFDLHKGRVLRNDASAGITKSLNKKVFADFYYLYRRNIQSGTKNENVLGVNFNFKFK
jgi:hypothetical protein